MMKVKLLSPLAKIPTRATPGSAGYDLYACIETEEMKILPKNRALVSTKISLQISSNVGDINHGFSNCYGRIAPRSGLSLKGIDICGGVIDSDYRGEIRVIIANNGDEDFVIKSGDRIAQLLLEHIYTPEIEAVEELGESSRGSGGFGSTGK